MERDDRIDLVRGFAMATIALNHVSALLEELGMRGPALPTLTAFGFSSAAELFVLLSGYMVGLVYLRRDRLASRVGTRAVKIYIYNLAAFGAALLTAWLAGRAVADATDAAYTLDRPLRGVAEFLLLRQHPELLGVLQLYVVLMLVTPAVAWVMMRCGSVIAAAASIGLYLSVQLLPDMNVTGGSPAGDWQWNFNPLAWQLLFFGGLLAGGHRLHLALFAWFDRRGQRIAMAIAVLAASVVCHRLYAIGQWQPPGIDKTDLGLLRIVHTGVVVIALIAMLSLARPILHWPAWRLLSALGRETLLCYALSIPLTYAIGGLWLGLGMGYAGYVALALALLGILVVAASWAGWRKSARSRPIPA